MGIGQHYYTWCHRAVGANSVVYENFEIALLPEMSQTDIVTDIN